MLHPTIPVRLLLALAIFLIITSGPWIPLTECHADPGDECWSDEFYLPGLSSIARAFTLYNGDLIVGGDFSHIEQMRVNSIARYDGENWWPMGDGFGYPGQGMVAVMDSIVYQNDLIVCGYFDKSGGSTVNNVARWNGVSWELMGVGFQYGQEILIEYNGDLYCESYRWNGNYWVEAFDVQGGISDMVVHDGRLVVAGNIDAVDGQMVESIFAWNGSEVEVLYQEVDFTFNALESFGNELYAISRYVSIPSTVIKWDEDHWQLVGDLDINPDYLRSDLVVYQDELVLVTAGTFGGGIRSHVILDRWDGASWHFMDTFPGNIPLSVFPYENGMLIGGNLCTDNTVVASNLLYWEKGVQHELFSGAGEGLNGRSGNVTHLSPSPQGLAVGGKFITAGQTMSATIALWNGEEWLDRGLQDTEFYVTTALHWANDQLASVVFPISPNILYYPIWWEDDTWQTGDDCPAVDRFFTWNGTTFGAGQEIYKVPNPWQITVLAQVDGGVAECLGEWNGHLVAGGTFVAVDGVSALGVALYDGVVWDNLAQGIDGAVLAVAEHNGLLIAAGSFSEAGSTPAASIAAWDGSSWQALGPGFDNVVRALAVYNGELFAAGSFHNSGPTAVEHIARWDGVQWLSLGSGTDEYVKSLAVYDGKLYVGGYFSFAGGKLAEGISYWFESPLSSIEPDNTPASSLPKVALGAPVPNPFNPVTMLSFELDRPRYVELEIYDLAGRLVVQLLAGQQDAGRHQIPWQGQNMTGQRVASGSYLVRLTADGFMQSRKVLLLY